MSQQHTPELCRQLLGAIEAWEAAVYPHEVGNDAAKQPGCTRPHIPCFARIDPNRIATTTDALRRAIRAVYGSTAPEIPPIEKLKLYFLAHWWRTGMLRLKEFDKVVNDADEAVNTLKDYVSDELEAWEAADETDSRTTKRKGGRRRLAETDPKFQVYDRIRREHGAGTARSDIPERLRSDRDFMEQVEAAKLRLNRNLVKAALAFFEQRKKQETPST
jgi:hypothetical protein